MKITAALLRKKGACKDDIKAFRKRWPKGCKITRENCRIAFGEGGLGLDITWAVDAMLSREAQIKYWEIRDPARAKYFDAGLPIGEAADARAWSKYHKARIEAFYLVARG